VQALGVAVHRVAPLGRRRAGALELAREVVALCDGRTPATLRFAYDDGARCGTSCASRGHAPTALPTSAPAPSVRQIKRLQAGGWGHLPVCVAKTQYSFSTDPALRARPAATR
jgi:formate--tetrahydrofolate ligase